MELLWTAEEEARWRDVIGTTVPTILPEFFCAEDWIELSHCIKGCEKPGGALQGNLVVADEGKLLLDGPLLRGTTVACCCCNMCCCWLPEELPAGRFIVEGEGQFTGTEDVMKFKVLEELPKTRVWPEVADGFAEEFPVFLSLVPDTTTPFLPSEIW